MPSQPLYLAIDQGGQSSRVAVFTAQGELLASESAPCATRQYQPEHSSHPHASYPHIEQDPLEILGGIRQCLARIAGQLGEKVAQIRAAGFAGQGSSLLCWDRLTGEALSPVLSWQDIRGEPYLAASGLSHQQVQALTGLRLSPHYGASKMRWCQEHIPAVAAARAEGRLCMGPIFSYLLWHLADGAEGVDPGHAQRTLLWNLHRQDWDETLLASFALDAACLPPCKQHNSHFGDISLAGQRIPIVAAARDQGASLFALGQPDACYINMGTGAFIQRLSPRLVAPEGLLVSPLWLPQSPVTKMATAADVEIEVASPTCYLDAAQLACPTNTYAWEATVNGAAAAIPFVEQQAGIKVDPQSIQRALALNPGADCYLLNAVGGLSAPYWRTDVEPRFGEGATTGDEKLLAWLESVVFQLVVNLRLMEALGATDKVWISGGLSQADALCQRIADLSGARVQRQENPDATAQGIACLAAAMPASWRARAEGECFYPQQNQGLSDRFARWQAALQVWLAA